MCSADRQPTAGSARLGEPGIVPAVGVDPAFEALPYRRLGEAALEAARSAGASQADFRFERLRTQTLRVRDDALETQADAETLGYSVRVVVDGSYGFAADVTQTADAAAAAAARAVDTARTLSVLNAEPVELAPEPPHTGEFISEYRIDPFDVPDAEKVELLLDLSRRTRSTGEVAHSDAVAMAVGECKYLASMHGTDVTQQRVRVQGSLTGTRIADGSFDTMRTLCPPRGSGWEHIAEYGFADEAGRLGDQLTEKMASRSVEPGPYDLVIDPGNLWLVIHESIGHSTELDRALGYEANYAGTSFATFDKLGELQVGSPVMHVTGDRTVPGGLSTVGWDDEGVEAQSWDIIRDGVLVGYQLSRQIAAKQGFERSNGCAFADAPYHVPIQRMPNVSLQPARTEVTLDDLIGGVDRGIYVVGDKSWSIDMQRYNFQFTGQRFYEIRGGRLVGQLRDVAYQGNTIEFWNSMEAVGGPSTWVLGGAFNCGKGQPGQVAPVSHGCPPGLFRGVNVLNTTGEAGR